MWAALGVIAINPKSHVQNSTANMGHPAARLRLFLAHSFQRGWDETHREALGCDG
jgi:hypothetical protein